MLFDFCSVKVHVDPSQFEANRFQNLNCYFTNLLMDIIKITNLGWKKETKQIGSDPGSKAINH